ncbi:MAG TPA: sulfurtransferase TusA family protein [Pseudomonadales bacterium]|nr:sulfurtransferase TusA family protein [Pseudomonadales bacterium]
MNNAQPTHELDARRLLCPLPVIRTQKKIRELKAGDHLTVYATDPGVQHDIPAWCRIHGHHLIRCEKINGEFVLLIEVGADS